MALVEMLEQTMPLDVPLHERAPDGRVMKELG